MKHLFPQICYYQMDELQMFGMQMKITFSESIQ